MQLLNTLRKFKTIPIINQKRYQSSYPSLVKLRETREYRAYLQLFEQSNLTMNDKCREALAKLQETQAYKTYRQAVERQ